MHKTIGSTYNDYITIVSKLSWPAIYGPGKLNGLARYEVTRPCCVNLSTILALYTLDVVLEGIHSPLRCINELS
jgi:hypothetical protein